MSLLTLELHYPPNWAFEGTVDVCYVDGVTGNEQSYGSLAQGATMARETYAGHTWNVRESVSRELLQTIVAQAPAGGGGMPQVVAIGSEAGLDPLKAAIWRMGRAPREPLLAATNVLLRVLGNALKHPDDPKYHSLRAANEKVAAALDVSGVLALLSCAGFEQQYADGEARLVHETGRPNAPLAAALAQLTRLECLLTGKPPPAESLASMQATNAAARASASAASSAAASEPSHRCAACGGGIKNDLRRQLAGSGEVGGWRTHQWDGGGEYRFHCAKCDVDLCSKCYDKWKAEPGSVHPRTCTFAIEAPITTPWGGSSYGPPPAPPAYNPRNRRGPWG